MQLQVQFNPFRSDPQQPDGATLHDLQDVYLGVAQRYELERGAHDLPLPDALPLAEPDMGFEVVGRGDREDGNERERQPTPLAKVFETGIPFTS